jgi:hypothetical protein
LYQGGEPYQQAYNAKRYTGGFQVTENQWKEHQTTNHNNDCEGDAHKKE